jgi:hypothetical protein
MMVEKSERAGMDALTLFGLVAVTATLVFYTFEERSPAFINAAWGQLGASEEWFSNRHKFFCLLRYLRPKLFV